MSEAKKQVLIVSLYDRGLYLSNELAERGHDVTLVNIPYKKSDINFWSNPFGYFKEQNLTFNQNYFLNGNSAKTPPEGLSLWLKDGPIDFKSKFSKVSLENRGITNKDEPKNLSWLESFSKSLFTTVNNLDRHADVEKAQIDMFGDFVYKNSSEECLDEERSQCLRLGVKIFDEKIMSIKKMQNKEILIHLGEQSYSFDHLICLASSYELNILNSEISSMIYGKSSIEPEWVWLSTEFDYMEHPAIQCMPDHFFALDDEDFVWAYKNFLIVKKDIIKNRFQVWMRWPFNEKHNLDYIDNEWAEVAQFFESKIKGLILKQTEPTSKHEAFPFYVYNKEQLLKFSNDHIQKKYITTYGPESWPTWDLMSIMKSQFKIIQERVRA